MLAAGVIIGFVGMAAFRAVVTWCPPLEADAYALRAGFCLGLFVLIAVLAWGRAG